MSQLYPLTFSHILKRYLWGGRRLGTELGKSIGEGADYAESWEICDRGDEQSRVLEGPLAGMALGELGRDFGRELYGRHFQQQRFPLLFKFLDAQTKLSVQVHPDDERGARLTPADFGKTEAWVILAAAPGAKIYAGLKRGFDRPALERELARGTCDLCLHSFEPKAGDCVFLPAGVVHAIGAGLLVAEIQQSSDTTYRLFDWNRTGPDGKPRQLHLEAGLEAIDYAAGPVNPQRPQATERAFVERLVDCPKFVLDRWTLDEPATCGGDNRFHLLAVLDGAIEIEHPLARLKLSRGATALLPANAGETKLVPQGRGVLLDMYLP